MKIKGREKIAVITAYDYVSARLVDMAGVDIILVDDSVRIVVYALSYNGLNATTRVECCES